MTSKEPEPLETIAPLLIGVQTHPERDISLESLAREWGYSPSHFHRLFTETVGETPKAHVERVRLERAAFRVAVESSSFLDIALAVGFRMERMRTFRGDGCTLSDYAERRGLAYRRVPITIPYDDPTVTPPHLQHLDACLPLVRSADGEGDIKRLDFAGGLYGAIEHRGPYETLGQAYRTVADGIRRSGRFAFRAGPPVQIFREWTTDADAAANLTEVYFPVQRGL